MIDAFDRETGENECNAPDKHPLHNRHGKRPDELDGKKEAYEDHQHQQKLRQRVFRIGVGHHLLLSHHIQDRALTLVADR